MLEVPDDSAFMTDCCRALPSVGTIPSHVQVVQWTVAVSADAVRLLTLPGDACPWQQDVLTRQACTLAGDCVEWASFQAAGPAGAGTRSLQAVPPGRDAQDAAQKSESVPAWHPCVLPQSVAVPVGMQHLRQVWWGQDNSRRCACVAC